MKKHILRPAGVPLPWPEFAAAVRAGPWLFVSGQMASDYRTGRPAPVRGHPGLPLHGEHVHIREAEWIMDRTREILAAGGSRLDLLVRVDQFPRDRAVIDPYVTVRNPLLGTPRPMSTSIGVTGLPFDDCSIVAAALAIGADSGLERVGVVTEAIPGPPGGYVSGMRVGDFVFMYGQLATDLRQGIPPEAQIAPALWFGNVAETQARYVLGNVEKILQAAGSSLANVVKANLYLADLNDLPRVNRVWREVFGQAPPARCIAPGTAFGVEGAAVEVNVVALADDGKTKKEIIAVDDCVPRFHESAVVRAGDLVFLSGLVAADANGLIAAARVETNALGLGPRRQTEHILATADALLQAAGSSLAQAVRADVYLTDMQELVAIAEVMRQRWGEAPPAMTIVQVPALYVPGCTVMIDLWAVTA